MDQLDNLKLAYLITAQSPLSVPLRSCALPQRTGETRLGLHKLHIMQTLNMPISIICSLVHIAGN